MHGPSLPEAVGHLQCLIEIPYNLVQALVFSVISYFMLGFDHTAGERLVMGWMFWLVLFPDTVVSESLVLGQTQ